MNAQLKGVEVETAVVCDDEFAIEDALLGELFANGVEHLGEVAIERLFIAALEKHFVAIAEDKDAEAVPLGLVDPVALRGNRIHAFGEHRQDGRVDGELHVNGVQVWPQECGCESVCSLLSERIGTDSVECRMYEQ